MFLKILFMLCMLLLPHKSAFSRWQQSAAGFILLPSEATKTNVGRNDSTQQMKPEKKRTLQDLNKERDSVRNEELKLSPHLQKIGRFAREVIQKMKNDGITRANAKAKHAEGYSNGFIQVD